MSALTGNIYGGKIQWMPNNVTVHWLGEQFAERPAIYIGRREGDWLVFALARALS